MGYSLEILFWQILQNLQFIEELETVEVYLQTGATSFQIRSALQRKTVSREHPIGYVQNGNVRGSGMNEVSAIAKVFLIREF